MLSAGDTTPQILRAHPGVRHAPTPKLDLFMVENFLSGGLCDELVALIEADRRPSTVADYNGDAAFRTSETCDLDVTNLHVGELERRLNAFHGIDPAHGETPQGQRYAVGQEFKQHTDWFNPGGTDWDRYCSVAGQRTWTFMIYLNDVAAGGGTRFKAIGKTIQPRKGKLLCWNNRKPDGSGNVNTLHHGMKVRAGVKYIITKWYREKPWG